MSTGSNNPESLRESDEARAKRERDAAQQQLMSQVTSGFSFFNILILGAILIGGYFLATSDKGKEWLGDLVGMLPESWQDTIAGFFAPKELTEAIKGDPTAMKRLRDIAREEGAPLADPITDKVVFRLLKEEGALVQTMLRNNQGKSTESDSSRKIMGVVKTILADPDKLAALLAPEQRPTTFAILEAASPIPFKPGVLGAFIVKVGLTPDGKPTPLLHDFIAAALQEDPAQRTKDLTILMARVDKPTRDALLKGIATDQITDPGLKTTVTQTTALATGATQKEFTAAATLQHNFALKGMALTSVATALTQDERGHTVAPAIMAGNLMGFMMDGTRREALMQGDTPALLATLARERAAATRDPQQRSLYQFLGHSENGKPTNVHALLNFMDRTARIPANAQDPDRTIRMVTGMVGLMTGDLSGTPPLQPTELAAFFHEPRNVVAMRMLLGEIREKDLPEKARGMIYALRHHWGNENAGLAEVMGDAESVAYMFSGKSGSGTIPEKGTFSRWAAKALLVPEKIGENLDNLAAIQKAMINAGMRFGGEAAQANVPTASVPGSTRLWVK